MARPRKFDEGEVLERVLRLFWQQGYESTSLSDLMRETKLTKSSLYKAFDSKADLYRRAMDRYDVRYLAFQREALKNGTPRKIAEALLYGTADLHTDPDTPAGCFETNGALACSADAEPIRRALLFSSQDKRERLARRLAEVAMAGPMIGNSPTDAADFIITLIQGMAVKAKGGATRAQLHRFIDLTMEAWPLAHEFNGTMVAA